MKKPADFIGMYIGHSEEKTRAILAATVGKVPIIDEAYGLSTGGSEIDNSGGKCPFRKGVQDTLVAEIQAVPGDDRCVILLGYETAMIDMFNNANEGLRRRFAFDTPFRFENYDLPQLEDILIKKMKAQKITASEPAINVVTQALDRARIAPTFSNAAAIDEILDKAKRNFQQRQSKISDSSKRQYDADFEPQDFGLDFNPNFDPISNFEKILDGQISKVIIEQLLDYLRQTIVVKRKGGDPRKMVPTTFVFKGPHGEFSGCSDVSLYFLAGVHETRSKFYNRHWKNNNCSSYRKTLLIYGSPVLR